MKKKYLVILSGIVLAYLCFTYINTESYYAIGYLYYSFLNLFRELSLSSKIGNAVAWIVLLFISLLPILLVYKHFNNKYLKFYTVIFSILLFFSMYLPLQSAYSENFLFIPLLPLMYANILLSILFGFLVEFVIYYMFVRGINFNHFTKYLPSIIIFYLSFVFTIHILNLFVNEVIASDFIYTLYYLIFTLSLIPILKEFSSDTSFNKAIILSNTIYKRTLLLLYLVLVTNVVLNLIPIFNLELQNYNVVFSIPVILIASLFILIWLTKILGQAKTIEDENRMFI